MKAVTNAAVRTALKTAPKAAAVAKTAVALTAVALQSLPLPNLSTTASQERPQGKVVFPQLPTL
jgi:hypothetical protein